MDSMRQKEQGYRRMSRKLRSHRNFIRKNDSCYVTLIKTMKELTKSRQVIIRRHILLSKNPSPRDGLLNDSLIDRMILETIKPFQETDPYVIYFSIVLKRHHNQGNLFLKIHSIWDLFIVLQGESIIMMVMSMVVDKKTWL